MWLQVLLVATDVVGSGVVTAEAFPDTEWRTVAAGTTHCGSKMAFPLLPVTADSTVTP